MSKNFRFFDEASLQKKREIFKEFASIGYEILSLQFENKKKRIRVRSTKNIFQRNGIRRWNTNPCRKDLVAACRLNSECASTVREIQVEFDRLSGHPSRSIQLARTG